MRKWVLKDWNWIKWESSLVLPHSTLISLFFIINTHSLSEMSVEWVRQSNPPNPLWQLNYWMRKEWDIFLRDFDFFTLIPGSFHHFWWEKMIKNWSRLIGIRKMSLWTEFNSVQSDNFLRAEGKFWTKVNPLDFFPPHSTLIRLFFHHSILIHYLK